jgi:hypothetical protein
VGQDRFDAGAVEPRHGRLVGPAAA